MLEEIRKGNVTNIHVTERDEETDMFAVVGDLNSFDRGMYLAETYHEDIAELIAGELALLATTNWGGSADTGRSAELNPS